MYAEWNNKAAAIVSYGVDGGVRAAQALRPVFGALQLADAGADVTLDLRTDFRDFGTAFTPGEHQTAALDALLGQLVTWSTALAATRTPNADCPTAAAPLEPGPWRRAARPARQAATGGDLPQHLRCGPDRRQSRPPLRSPRSRLSEPVRHKRARYLLAGRGEGVGVGGKTGGERGEGVGALGGGVLAVGEEQLRG